MASDMPNRYIDREGILEEETARVVKANDMAGIEKQNQVLQEEMALLKQGNEQLGTELPQLRKKYNDLFEVKGFMTLLSSLSKKQKQMSKAFERFTGKKFDFEFSLPKVYLRKQTIYR